MKSLAIHVYETIHRAKKPGTKSDVSVDELADLIGCSPSLLYKAVNPNEQVDIKLSWLIPLMKATNNFSILRHLAIRCGFVLVKIPRARKMRPEQIAEHQKTLAAYQMGLIKYMQGEIEADEVHELVDKALTEIASAKKMVEAGESKQQELFENLKNEEEKCQRKNRSTRDRSRPGR